jgi:hypothetical protein
MPTATQVALPVHEGRLLTAHLDRLNSWDGGGCVRLIARGQALGIYSAPPMGVLAFAALPLLSPVSEPIDVVMSLPAARSALNATADEVTLDLVEAAGATPALAVLPPADGWHLPIQGVAGDVIPQVEELIAEFKSRSPYVADAQTLAEQLWDRPTFGGLPLRVLHAARRLGFLVDDGSRVTACTTSGWKRFTTVRGQIFLRTVPPGQRPLRVVR